MADFTNRDPTDRSMALASLLGERLNQTLLDFPRTASLGPYPEPHGPYGPFVDNFPGTTLPYRGPYPEPHGSFVDNFPGTALPYQGPYLEPYGQFREPYGPSLDNFPPPYQGQYLEPHCPSVDNFPRTASCYFHPRTAFEEADHFSLTTMLPSEYPFEAADHVNFPRTASYNFDPRTAFEEADHFSLRTMLPSEHPFEVADHVNLPRSVWPLDFPFEDVDHAPIKGHEPQESPRGTLLPDVDVFYQGLTLEFPGEGKQVNGAEEEEQAADGESQPLIGEPEPSRGCCGEWERRLAERAAAVVKRIKSKLMN